MSSSPKGVQRLTQILDCIASSPSAPMAREIFERLHLPRSSGYDLLSDLTERQFVQQRPDGRWHLGKEIDNLALSRLGLAMLEGRVDPVPATLQVGTQQSAHLGVLHQGTLLTTHAVGEARSTIQTAAGTRLPFNWTAGARFLVSGLSDHQIKQLFATYAEPSPSGRAITNASVFNRQVLDALNRGYAIEVEEARVGCESIAAPVRDPGGRCIAAITLTFPVTALKSCRDTLVALICEAAAKLNSRTGLEELRK